MSGSTAEQDSLSRGVATHPLTDGRFCVTVRGDKLLARDVWRVCVVS